MTRKTALEQIRFDYGVSNKTQMINIINKIYDEFDAMTCENCEYYNKIGTCTNEESMMFDKLSFDDFGCNKFIKDKK